MKLRLTLLLIIIQIFSCAYGQIGNDTLFIYNNILEKDNSLTLDDHKVIIEKAISYSKEEGLIYEELYFRGREIDYYFSTANYSHLLTLSLNFLEDVEENMKSYKHDDKWTRLHIDALYNLGIAFVFQGNFIKGTELFHKTTELYPNNVYAKAKSYNGLGIISANKSAWDKAYSYFSECLDLYQQLNEKNGIFKTHSNIGLLYLSQDKYQESLSSFLKAHQVVVEMEDTGEKQINANYFIAMAYSGMENYTMANTFFVEAINIAKEKQYKRLLCFSQFNYAKSLFKQGSYNLAEKESKLSLQYFTESGMIQMEAETMMLLANIYEAKKNYQLALDYQKQYADKLNKFLKTEKEENMQKLESSIEDYKLQNKIIDFELTKANLSYRNLQIGVLAGVAIILLIVLIILLRKFFIQRKTNTSVMEHLEEIKRNNIERVKTIEEHMNNELNVKNKELLSNSLLFLRLNSMTSTIMEKIEILKKSVSKPNDKILLYEVENLISDLALDKDWGEFELYFLQTDNDFFNKLSERFPSLSPAEKRMCVLFSLDLKNKEIATLMQKSHQSISMAKIRIKRKINVESNEELVNLLNGL
ncbi:tetratricopeptide repeat protein [Bacteroidales bacterium OttesenSCG-928-I14]|nr:tetratricopeptide repeat protein [Bacteroidales bacterium OttesenSCG-928-I14]